MEFSSKLLENAVYEMSQLPGVGKRTALRLVLHLLRQPETQTHHLAEATSQYKGLYHVLGGKISPLDGIGPQELNIYSLIEKVKEGRVKEIIFALSSTMEGDTTNFYIYKQVEEFNIQTSTIARGISVGDELEYADEVTLGRSILHRIPFESSLKN